MHERAERLLRRPVVEVLRIQRDLVGRAPILAMLEPVVGEVAERVGPALEGDQAPRESAREERSVEVAHGGLQRGVSTPGRIDCCAHYTQMIQQPDPRVVAKVALSITASPYEQQPQIFKQVLDAWIETCCKQGWSGQENFDYVGAYGDLLIASWSQETGPH